MVAAAPLSSIWPGPLPLVDIPNWDDDVYLTGGGADASLGSRFTESEPYAWRVVFLLMIWPRSSPSQPTAPSCAPTSQLHRERPFLHRLHIIHPSDCPRFAELGSLWIPMVQGHSVTPPSTLRWSACTIPTLDFYLPAVLFYFHRPYHSPTTTGGWSRDVAQTPSSSSRPMGIWDHSATHREDWDRTPTRTPSSNRLIMI